MARLPRRLPRPAVLLAVAVVALAGGIVVLGILFPGSSHPTTEPRAFAPGVWETADHAYRIDLRPDGTGELVGYDEEGRWVCGAPEEFVEDPSTPRTQVTWDPPSGGTVGIDVHRGIPPGFIESMWPEGQRSGFWGATEIYPCGDPDLGMALLVKVLDY